MKNLKLYIATGILAIGVATVFGLKSCTKQSTNGLETTAKLQKKAEPKNPFIKAINSSVNTLFTEYTFNADNDYTLKHASGTEIYFPKGSLTDAEGNVIGGNVNIKYREFMNKESLMSSGIPMRLKDDDYYQFLVSSGMMEIYAEQNGKAIFVNNSNQVQVNLINTTAENGYNVYYLDTNKREWVETLNNLKANIKKVVSEIKVAVNSKKEVLSDEKAAQQGYINPVKPVAANKKRYQFHFKINLKPFPELNVYDGIMFEFAGNSASENPDKNEWVKNMFWHEMELLPTSKKGIYKLKLSTPEKTFVTTVKPVFDAEDMEYAMDVYKDRYDRYRTFMAKRKKDEKDYQTRVKTSEFITRSFAINRFGVWNTDKLENIQEAQPLMVNLTHTDTSVKFVTAYMIIKAQNGTVNLTVKNNTILKFQYPSVSDARLLLTDMEGKCYLIDEKQMDKLSNTGTEVNFEVKQRGVIVANENDVKKVMG